MIWDCLLTRHCVTVDIARADKQDQYPSTGMTVCCGAGCHPTRMTADARRDETAAKKLNQVQAEKTQLK